MPSIYTAAARVRSTCSSRQDICVCCCHARIRPFHRSKCDVLSRLALNPAGLNETERRSQMQLAAAGGSPASRCATSSPAGRLVLLQSQPVWAASKRRGVTHWPQLRVRVTRPAECLVLSCLMRMYPSIKSISLLLRSLQARTTVLHGICVRRSICKILP